MKAAALAGRESNEVERNAAMVMEWRGDCIKPNDEEGKPYVGGRNSLPVGRLWSENEDMWEGTLWLCSVSLQGQDGLVVRIEEEM